MTNIGWIVGGASFLLAFIGTPLVAVVVSKLGIVDIPREDGRKVHKKSTPLLGGVGVYVALAIVTIVVLWRADILLNEQVRLMHYGGILLGGLILIISGALDDIYDLSPKWQIIAPILAATVVILGGVGIDKITNPFGDVFLLEAAARPIIDAPWWRLVLSWPGDAIVFVWLLGMMYTTKLLDGLDGLATGVGSVGALMVILLASSAAYFQPDIAVFASIVLGAYLGFLVWNVHPAKIFLGEGGSLLVGFLLGVLAIISGGKIATLLLVMGVPILDVVWVMFRRFRSGSKVTKGDRKHLHHRLFDLGLSQNVVLAIYLVLALGFGALTLILPAYGKLIALLIIAIVMLSGGYFVVMMEGSKKK